MARRGIAEDGSYITLPAHKLRLQCAPQTAPRPSTRSSHATRRKFFKYAGLGALLAGLASAIAWKAHAHGRCGHGPIDPARLEEHLDRALKHFYVEIDATPEQQQKLAPIVQGRRRATCCRCARSARARASAASSC